MSCSKSLFSIVIMVALGATASASSPAVSDTASSADSRPSIDPARLALAGSNRGEIEKAVERVPADQTEGMLFLLSHMRTKDLRELTAEMLLENVRLAYLSRREDPWAKAIPDEIFLNDVLPYASVDEVRESWRADFRKRFLPLVQNAKTPREVAVILNNQIFGSLGVRYSTGRAKAQQSPSESIASGKASCSGLSILLIDACRSVGVPARFVGTPLWIDGSGNHSWVEVWDNGWHFTGAAEPTGNALNRGWFVDRAAKAVVDDPSHAIYATSYRPTGLSFPLVWAPNDSSIAAVNVTQRYTALAKPIDKSKVLCRFRLQDESGRRLALPIVVKRRGEVVAQGTTHDDRFDTNDHLTIELPRDESFVAQIIHDSGTIEKTFQTLKEQKQIQWVINTQPEPSVSSDASRKAVADFRAMLGHAKGRVEIQSQPFAKVPLTRKDAEQVRAILAADRAAKETPRRKVELQSGVIKSGTVAMPFVYQTFGKKPAKGWSLYISMHGGGNASPATNDRQWENQKRLYQLKEGIYLVPRAPSNTWDLWHQSHIDGLFDRLIDDLALVEGVNRNRVYIMGYSAGGDGVYQLASRMSDRWAAAAMMAGHPNETTPIGLRNVPFALQVGGKDAAYNRNTIAQTWKDQLVEYQRADPKGYQHFVKIYPGKGHWMDLEDKIALDWMAKFDRNPVPQKIVWKQDDVTHSESYWLSVESENRKAGALVIADVQDQTITLECQGVDAVTITPDDRFIDLDQPIRVVHQGETLFLGTVDRTIGSLSETFAKRGDPDLSFPASIRVRCKSSKPVAMKTPEALNIDGRLDEPIWSQTPKTESFVDLVSGHATPQTTHAAVTWDDRFLYFGFWIDEPNVTAQFTQRDDPIYQENDVEVFIASDDAYYEFEINANATIYDGLFVWKDSRRAVPVVGLRGQRFNGVGFTKHPRGPRVLYLDYDMPNIEVAVGVQGTLNDASDIDAGWTVEVAMPWKDLQILLTDEKRVFPPRLGDRLSINLFRFNDDKLNDSGGWAVKPHGIWDSHIPEVFPEFTFTGPRHGLPTQ